MLATDIPRYNQDYLVLEEAIYLFPVAGKPCSPSVKPGSCVRFTGEKRGFPTPEGLVSFYEVEFESKGERFWGLLHPNAFGRLVRRFKSRKVI